MSRAGMDEALVAPTVFSCTSLEQLLSLTALTKERGYRLPEQGLSILGQPEWNSLLLRAIA